MYTCVCRLEKGDNRIKVMETAMKLNFMQYGTHGATLGMEEDEVDLCFSTPIAGLCANDFLVQVETFLNTAVEVNEKLDLAKRQPLLTRHRPHHDI